MSAKHTPGPWSAGISSGRKVLCVTAANGTWVCGELLADNETAIDTDEAEANARLIAAAPDMAAALDRIFSYVSYVNIHGVGEQPEPREDGFPQPMRVQPEEFQRIFQEIGTLASFTLSKAGA